MKDPGLDGVDRSNSADLQKDVSGIASANALASKDSYTITIENLPVKLAGKYNFVFQYYYVNPDESQSTPVLGPKSATYSIELDIPCIATVPTNVVTAGGFYSYQVKWDMPTFASYADTIVYESNTNSFSASSKVVYVGTSNQCNILTSDLVSKYVYVVHRDMFRQSCIAGFVAGPIVIKDPIIVDANPPTNDFSVGTATVQDDPDGLFTFNKKVLFNWTENTDTSTYGYQIRFRRVGTTDYTYMSVPGRTVTSTYLYGLKAGQTYEIGVTTYDQFGNTNTSDWKSYPNIVIPASTSLAADVAITAGDMKMGYGIGGDNANKGLYLGPENYWYVIGNTTASSAARLSVGGTGDRLLWNGTNLSVTGNLSATGGTFSGNILLSSTNASIYNGTINAGGNLTGNGFALNATGLKVQNGTNSVTLDASNGQITANAGSIGGWQLTSSGLSNNNARLNSTLGTLELGGYNADDIVHLDANDANYRMWIGKNSSATAPFKVSKAGVLTASGAIINGNASFSGTLTVGTQLSDGTTIDTVKLNAASGAQASADLSALSTRVSGTENSLTFKTSTSDFNDLVTVVGLKAAKSYVDGQLNLKASLTDLGNKLDTTAFSVAAVAAKINAIDTSVTTIDGGKITTGSILSAQIGAGQITAVKIGSREITADKVGASEITAYEIAGGTITAAEIASGTITADEISAGTITAAKIAATQTFTGHIIVGDRIASSSSSTRIELINSTTDSLRVLIGGSVKGHVLGYGNSTTGGMVMMAGTTADAGTTSGHVRVLPNYAVLAGTSTRYVEATSTQVNVSGTTYLGVGAYNVYMVSGDTTTSAANLFINSTTGQLARSTSSRKYKDNISSISIPDSSIMLLNPVKFQGKSDIKYGDETYKIGLIAEEVAAIPGMELLVNYNEDGSPESLSYERLSVLLTDAIKRILNRLDALEA
jgi:hypothetical protein